MLLDANLMKEIDESVEATFKSRFAFIIKGILEAALKGESKIELFVFETSNEEFGLSSSEKIKNMLTDLGFETEIKTTHIDFFQPIRTKFTFLINW